MTKTIKLNHIQFNGSTTIYLLETSLNLEEHKT